MSQPGRIGTRERILEGAIELIARYGLQKTTMEEIAQRARLKPASVYYYFKSKEDVLAAVVRHQADTILARIRSAIDDADGTQDKLTAFLLARFSYMDLLGHLEGAEMSAAYDAFPMIDSVVREYRDRAEELLIEVLVLGQERGDLVIEDPRRLGRGMFTVMGAMDSMLVTNPMDPETQEGLLELLRVFLKGVRSQ